MARIIGDCCSKCGKRGVDLTKAVMYDSKLICKYCIEHEHTSNETRTFNSGATRDTTEGKLSYVKALSPIVLQRYVQYLDVHRKQSNGSMREFDNWKQGIPKEAYLDGSGRHFIAVWLLEHGFSASDNHGPVTLEDSLCGIIFNAMGRLHELLKEKPIEFVCPEGWEITYNNPLSKHVCGWYVKNKDRGVLLWKNGLLEDNCYSGWDNHKYGEAPGYWPTKQGAEAALAAYLEKQGVAG